jgi:multicomponent K+:H+ antiporter subunit D
MTALETHLIVVPILAPLIAAALTLLVDERWRRPVTLVTVLGMLIVALVLLYDASVGRGLGEAYVYLLGNWPAPFGIVLVADRLSALMLALTGVLATAALVFSFARWDRAGPRFYALFLLLLMGLNGAFLTGDLFNLFVFFEVLLAASYGLTLHGSGPTRVKAGLHYVAVNLSASSLFLIGVSLIYGAAGTLNMAHLATRVPELGGETRALFEVGCAVLGIAFLVKAGMWPLGFWLPPTYSAASAPAAALFSVMTKLGVYVILRLSLLLFDTGAGASAGFGAPWLMWGGLATLVMAAIGAFASNSMSRIAGFCVLMSSGTLLAVIGAGGEQALAGALFYLASSTLAVSAFFLLIELINRARGTIAPAIGRPVFADEFRDPYEDRGGEEVGELIPAPIALLSSAFLFCTMLLAGMPPLSGFLGKFAMMAALLEAHDPDATVTWVLIGALTVSTLATLIALTRIGIEVFWSSPSPPPSVRRTEGTAIAALLIACLLLTVFAGPAVRYLEATAAWLHTPSNYIRAVLDQAPARAETQASSP